LIVVSSGFREDLLAMLKLAFRAPDSRQPGDIASESHHRIANHLTILSSVIRMQMRAVSKGPAMCSRESVSTLLSELLDKVISIAEFHRTLSGHMNDVEINLAEYVHESCAGVVAAMGLSDRAKIITGFDQNCHATPEQAQLMAMIAHEIVLNAIKYAHPTGIRVLIRLGCRRPAGGRLSFEIADDGIGLPEGFDTTTDGGIGFALIRSLVASLGASMSIESDSLGTTFRFLFECVDSSDAQCAATAHAIN
jgi:two-component sensor histidine kinase